jgi:hypothetical protein
MSSSRRAASSQTGGMLGLGFRFHASRANSTWAGRGRMISFQWAMRFMMAGTPSMIRSVASLTWANRSREPLWRMEKLPKSEDWTIIPFAQTV